MVKVGKYTNTWMLWVRIQVCPNPRLPNTKRFRRYDWTPKKTYLENPNQKGGMTGMTGKPDGCSKGMDPPTGHVLQRMGF